MPSGNTRSGPWRQPSAQKEAGKRLHQKARASSRTQKALQYPHAFGLRKPCCRFGKASSAGVARHHPSAQAQPRKAPSTAIHALRPTPGSKLPSAAKREQALALKKPCGTKTLLECGSSASALAKPACWRRAPPPQRSSPTTKSSPFPRSTPCAPPQEASFPPPQSESKLSHSRSAEVPSRF